MMDTTKFDDLSAEAYKQSARSNWTEAPCGSHTSSQPYLSRAYFDEVEAFRYMSHPWILANIQSFDLRAKKALEIGYGMGTDHLALARQGAQLTGIDLTPGNKDVTERRFALYGYTSELLCGDTEKLPFADDTFDFVYSLGVIHHTPDTAAAVREIHRVLKPGGRCHIAVYNKNSVFFWWTVVVVNYLLRGGWRKRTLKQQISLLEYPNTNENIVVRLQTRSEFEGLFHQFSAVSSRIFHLIPEDVAYLTMIYRKDTFRPRPLLEKIGRWLGWYIVVDAIK